MSNNTNTNPTFKKIAANTYEVRLNGVLAGTVTKLIGWGGMPYWLGHYNDGVEAYADYKRIDCAWRLINS